MRVAACIIEHLAKEFHDTYERLAPEYGYETREASAVPWADVPEQNKALMMATVEHVMAGAVARVEALEQGIRVFLAAEHDTLESTPAYLALVLRRGQ